MRRNVRYNLLFQLLRSKRFKLKNSIVLFSEPRSGSTWLTEILKIIPNSVINLEPLHFKNGIVPEGLSLGWYPYLRIYEENGKYFQLFKNTLTLKRFNHWTCSKLGIKELLKAKIVITKFVLASGLLPWFVKKFGTHLQYKPIFLIRHPIATVVSQLRTLHGLTGDNFTAKSSVRGSSYLPQDLKNPMIRSHQQYINSLPTLLEKHVAVWCINNKTVLEGDFKNDLLTVFYEDLVLNPYKTCLQIFEELGVEIQKDRLMEFNFNRPSASNFLSSFQEDDNLQLKKVVKEVPREDLERAQRVLNYFEINVYSAFNAYPQK